MYKIFVKFLITIFSKNQGFDTDPVCKSMVPQHWFSKGFKEKNSF